MRRNDSRPRATDRGLNPQGRHGPQGKQRNAPHDASAVTYCGLHQDTHGMTMLGRVVLDAWLFEVLPREQDCAGWDLGRMQQLMDQVQARWDEHGALPSRLPPELRQRHAELYTWATERAQLRGWNPELAEDE